MKKLLVFLICFLLFSPALVLPVFAETTTITTNFFLAATGDKKEGVAVFGERSWALGFLYSGSAYLGSTGIDGKVVSIQYQYIGKPWTNLASVTTQAITDPDFGLIHGYFEKGQRPTQTVYYRAVFSGDTSGGTIYSPSTSNIARTIVKVKVDISGVKTKKYYKVYGLVGPSKAGRSIHIIVRKSGGNWKTVKKVKLNGSSRYAYRYYFSKKGIYYIKAFYPGDKYNGRNSSKVKSFTVK